MCVKFIFSLLLTHFPCRNATMYLFQWVYTSSKVSTKKGQSFTLCDEVFRITQFFCIVHIALFLFHISANNSVNLSISASAPKLFVKVQTTIFLWPSCNYCLQRGRMLHVFPHAKKGVKDTVGSLFHI